MKTLTWQGDGPRGVGSWDFASNDGGDPDVVMACEGDVPTLETLAAVDLLRKHLPGLKIRVVNVVDLIRLQDPTEHPRGLPDREFDALFTTRKPVIFGTRAVATRQYFADQRVRHRAHVTTYGEDLPEVREWRWTS